MTNAARPRAEVPAPGGSSITPMEQDKLAALFASLDEGLLLLDEQQRVDSVNAQAERILELPAAAMLGRSVDSLAASWRLRDRGPFAVSKMRHHLVRGLPYRNDDAFVVSEAGIRHVSLVMTPVEEHGAHRGAVICLRDITELKVVEHRLRESETRLRRVFASAPTGMVQISEGGEIVGTNVAFARMVGRTEDDLLGAPFGELHDPATGDASQLTGPLGSVFRAGDAWQGELSFRGLGGTTVWTNTSVALVRSSVGGTRLAVAVVEDLTERKRLEVELRHAAKLEAIGRLAAGVAHELNTPIQFIGDNVRFLAQALEQLATAGASDTTADRGFLLEEVPSAVRETLEGLDRVASIVHAMRSFGRTGEGPMVATDLNELVRTTLLVAAHHLREVAEVRAELDDQLPAVDCSEADIKQVVLNLLLNAADAVIDAGRTAGGCIVVSTRSQDDGVVLSVSDDGGGIDERIADRVFDPFFTTKEVGRGTGQGLALAHAVAERHAARLWFDTDPGAGTTFHLWFPVWRGPGRASSFGPFRQS